MVKIIADSGCELTNEMLNKVTIVPLNLQLGDNTYIDDKELDIDNFIKELHLNRKNRKTSAPAPFLYSDNFDKDNKTFVITISSKLSGSYNSARTAIDMFLEEHSTADICLIDSKSASAAETLIVNKLIELDKNNMTYDEIKKEILEFRDNIKTYFILENYDTFVDSGRISPHVAKLGQMLNIIPICGAEDGKAVVRGQARGEKKAYAKFLEFIKNENVDTENRILAITHVDCLEKAEKLKNIINENFKFKDIIINKATGLCSVYADINGLIIAF